MCCAAEEGWVVTVGGIAQAALHHPVDHKHQQGGWRWSCKAQEGFDLRAPANSYCSNLKPERLVYSSALIIFSSNFCFSFLLLLLCPPTVYILLSPASLNNWSLNEQHLAASPDSISFTFSPPSSSSSLNLFFLFQNLSLPHLLSFSLISLSLSLFAGQSDSDETLPAVF